MIDYPISSSPCLLQIPILSLRWNFFNKLLIPKDKNLHIDRLRNITLVEADLQFILKCVWNKQFVTPLASKKSSQPNQFAQKQNLFVRNLKNKIKTYSIQPIKET